MRYDRRMWWPFVTSHTAYKEDSNGKKDGISQAPRSRGDCSVHLGVRKCKNSSKSLALSYTISSLSFRNGADETLAWTKKNEYLIHKNRHTRFLSPHKNGKN